MAGLVLKITAKKTWKFHLLFWWTAMVWIFCGDEVTRNNTAKLIATHGYEYEASIHD